MIDVDREAFEAGRRAYREQVGEQPLTIGLAREIVAILDSPRETVEEIRTAA